MEITDFNIKNPNHIKFAEYLSKLLTDNFQGSRIMRSDYGVSTHLFIDGAYFMSVDWSKI